MSAKYIYTQIIRGNLKYEEIFAINMWKKYRPEVDVMLRENGYEELIKPVPGDPDYVAPPVTGV